MNTTTAFASTAGACAFVAVALATPATAGPAHDALSIKGRPLDRLAHTSATAMAVEGITEPDHRS